MRTDIEAMVSPAVAGLIIAGAGGDVVQAVGLVSLRAARTVTSEFSAPDSRV
ncbi:hypothetical protein ABH922_001611 [Rhodococcus sp. 27YEA15]|uniref:hypothetical protein n=1 Tax=Rhodococcus sp. 27YEA15 TaxID=3156259 RepID=UPI003C7DBC4A